MIENNGLNAYADFTYRIGEYFLRFECINRKHCDVGNQQKGDNLTGRFGAIMFGQMDTTTWHVGDEQQLENNL